MLGLKLEILVNRTKEHLPVEAKLLENITIYKKNRIHLRDLNPILVVVAGKESLQLISASVGRRPVLNVRR